MLSALSTGPTRHLPFAVLFASVLAGISGSTQQLDPTEIIQRSAEINRRDWDAAPTYDYFQRERDGEKIKTSEVIMLAGSRYYRLVAVDDKPLSAEDEAKAQQRFQKAIAQRREGKPPETRATSRQYHKKNEPKQVPIGGVCFTPD